MYSLDPIINVLLVTSFIVAYVLFGPHRLLFLIACWYEENSNKARNELYNRVGVPYAAVVSHRKFQSDGTMHFRYAYRPPNNPNMIYVREYIREPKHQSYPWDDDKILVVLIVPGHCASGLEVRRLSEPAETYWRKISISLLVTIWVFIQMLEVDNLSFLIWISILLFLVQGSPKTDRLYEKIDISDLSAIEGQSSQPDADGEACPTFVQDLSRGEMIPSLQHAEAVIKSHLQLLRRKRNVESFERDLLRYFARCNTAAESANNSNPSSDESTCVEATAVVASSLEDYSSSDEHGDLEMATQVIEQVPLLSAETMDTDRKK